MPVFKRYANVIPVKGALRSTLCDLQRGRIKLIPNDLYHLLTAFKDQSLAEIKDAHPEEDHAVIDEYYQFLLEDDWGFLCDEPESFPELDLSYAAAALITNAIVDVASHSDHDYRGLVTQLDGLGCSYLQVRAYCPLTDDHLKRILLATEGSRLRSVEIFAQYDPEQGETSLIELMVAHRRLHRLVIHGAPEHRVVNPRPESKYCTLTYQQEAIVSHQSCGVVNRDYFRSSLEVFSEALHYNSCLNQKLSVDVDGLIRNCPSMNTHFGFAAGRRLAEVALDPKFQAIWHVTKDQVAVCRDCEFRYVCSDCRAYTENDDPYAKPQKCGYDPYTAAWAPAPMALVV